MKQKTKITIYGTSEFFGSIVKIEAKLVETGRANYAQYDNAPFIKYVPKSKRTTYIKRGTYKPYILVLNGWGYPEPAGMFNEGKTDENTGVTVRESTYQSFDDGFVLDFDKVIAGHITDTNLIMDIRHTMGTNIINEPVQPVSIQSLTTSSQRRQIRLDKAVMRYAKKVRAGKNVPRYL